MCQRYSFVLSPAGKVLDGCGLPHSHTTILTMHGVASDRHGRYNLYEWQPPEGWPNANWADGLTKDREAFEPKVRAVAAMERRIKKLYPDLETWRAKDPIRWAELPLPNADRVQRAYDCALRAKPLAWVDDAAVLECVNRHLELLGGNIPAATVVANAASAWDSAWAGVRASVWASVRASVWDSAWASVWASAWASVWDRVWASVCDSVLASVWDNVLASVRDSVWAAMVLQDAKNPWLPLLDLAERGCYLYGVTDSGVAVICRKEQ